jgi:hypothetical protein
VKLDTLTSCVVTQAKLVQRCSVGLTSREPPRSIALADLAGDGPRCYPVRPAPGPAFGRPEDKLRPLPMVGIGPGPPVPCRHLLYDPNGIRLELLASQTTARRPRWSRASCRPGRRRAPNSLPCPASRLSGSKSASPPCQTDRADPHAAPISPTFRSAARPHIKCYCSRLKELW